MDNRGYPIAVIGGCSADTFHCRERAGKIWSRSACHLEAEVTKLCNSFRTSIGLTDRVATPLNLGVTDPDSIKSR